MQRFTRTARRAQPRLSRRMQASLDLFFAELGQGVNALNAIEERRATLVVLDGLSDADLLRLGLTRARIPGYVFRDLFPSW